MQILATFEVLSCSYHMFSFGTLFHYENTFLIQFETLGDCGICVRVWKDVGMVFRQSISVVSFLPCSDTFWGIVPLHTNFFLIIDMCFTQACPTMPCNRLKRRLLLGFREREFRFLQYQEYSLPASYTREGYRAIGELPCVKSTNCR